MRSGILPCYIDHRDLAQVRALARLQAEEEGEDPDEAARKAAKKWLAEERALRVRVAPQSSLFGGIGTLGWVAESSRVVSLRPAKPQTPGQRKRFLRNQAILALSIAGFSQRQLADVFDLPHSRIAAIIDDIRALLA